MKFDTSKIENFDNLTADELKGIISKIDIPEEIDLSQYVSKELFDKTASELSAAKKTIKNNMSEDEALKLQLEQEQKEKDELISSLQRKIKISEDTSNLLKLGYDEKLAVETAEAISDGDTAKVFSNMQKYKSELEKNIKAEYVKGTPRPQGGNIGKQYTTIDEIMKIEDYEERQNAIAQHIDLWENNK